MQVIVTFLAILELMKTGKIHIKQDNIFDDIEIEAVSENTQQNTAQEEN